MRGWGVQPAQPPRHYVTRSRTHWLLVPGGQDTAASSVNPFLSILGASLVTQRDLHGTERWPPVFGQLGGCLLGTGAPVTGAWGILLGPNPAALFSQNGSKKPNESFKLSQAFPTCLGFWDKWFTEGLGCTRGWCQPSHPSRPLAAAVLNPVLEHGCQREGLMCYLHQLFLLEMCLLQPLT